ncbi:hypothetical protein B0A52_04723 [Exophiala mesophila]|uniref:TPR-like protein n=1 Tax=Exophiala mesophila TaxID=212818 RepID=A0A438N8Q4_EXOME|nr:hypothetical protein B0A52_04723 [Exophiala mesophila]
MDQNIPGKAEDPADTQSYQWMSLVPPVSMEELRIETSHTHIPTLPQPISQSSLHQSTQEDGNNDQSVSNTYPTLAAPLTISEPYPLTGGGQMAEDDEDDAESGADASDDGNDSIDEAEERAVQRTMGIQDVSSYQRKRKAPQSNQESSNTPPQKRRKKGTGRRGGWSKGLKIGPRPAMEPSPEFTRLHQQALSAFIDEQDSEQARDLILRAIAINPEIYAAHALLSEIYFSRDETEKAIAALFSGAHSAARDAAVWRQVADACLTHSKDNREIALQQASYCYARIIHNDTKDIDARLERCALSRELGNIGKANKDLDALLKLVPRDAVVMRHIAEIGIETKNTARAKALYEETIQYYKDTDSQGEKGFTWAHLNTYIQLLANEEPAEVARTNAITSLRQLSRWLLGREDESFWDNYDADDREWDAEDEPRRLLVPQHFPGEHSPDSYGLGLPLEIRIQLGILRLQQGHEFMDEAMAHFEWLEPEARDDLASVYDFPDLFLQVAQTLLSIKCHEQALRYFEALRDVEAYNDVEFWLGIATCYYAVEDKAKAIQCYEAAKIVDSECGEARTQLAKLYTDLDEKEKAIENAREAVRIAEAATKLTEKRKYERKEHRLARTAAENALKQAFQLSGPAPAGLPVDRIESRLNRSRERQARSRKLPRRMPRTFAATPDHRSSTDESAASKIVMRTSSVPRPQPMSLEDKETYRTQGDLRIYDDLLANTDAMRSGDEAATRIWIECSTNLIADFCSNRKFFPSERNPSAWINANENASKSHKRGQGTYGLVRGEYQPRSLPSAPPAMTYRNISFPEWLDLFLEHAMLQAKLDTREACYRTITTAIDCDVWHADSAAQLRIYIAYFACCLALRDDATLFNIVLRWFLRTYQFCTDAYRLFAATNLVFPHPMDKGGKDGQNTNAPFRSGPTQKFMFRQIMMMDANLPLDYNDGSEWGPVPNFMRRQRDGVRIEVQPNSKRVAGESDGESEYGLKSGDIDQINDSPSDFVTPKEMDVVLLTLYAHLLYAGGSFVNALSYFFRARSLDPESPVILLSISLAYFHEMLKRQNENRHMYALQGWSFFDEYVELRRNVARDKDREFAEQGKTNLGLQHTAEVEIEFNRARIWQMLGMADLAIRAYEKALALRQKDETSINDDENNDNYPPLPGDINSNDISDPKASSTDLEFTMEAAYAIQTMYALSGNMDMARSVAEKYLVV